MAEAQKLDYVIKNKKVYEATACIFSTTEGSDGEEQFTISFEYENGMGNISKSPTFSIPKECLASLTNYWKEHNLI